jgi:hypothetical protein
MKEDENAARFESDLEALRRGGAPAPGADSGALEVARRLGGLDWSAESKVQRSLRARLLARQPSSQAGLWPSFGLSLPVGARAALAAAFVALLLLLPLRPVFRRHRPSAQNELALHAASAPETPAAESIFEDLGPGSPFESCRPLAGGGSLFATAEGRRVGTESGRAVVWELEGAAFILEDRSIRIEDIFVQPTL